MDEARVNYWIKKATCSAIHRLEMIKNEIDANANISHAYLDIRYIQEMLQYKKSCKTK